MRVVLVFYFENSFEFQTEHFFKSCLCLKVRFKIWLTYG